MDQFSIELKTICTWLKLLVAELNLLHGLFGKRKEHYGTRHFLKVRVEKKTNKPAPGFELFEMLSFKGRFVGFVFLSTSFDGLYLQG